MDKMKEIFGILLGGRLVVEGNGRTFAKVPAWLAAAATLLSVRLAVVTALLIVAFGMKVSVTKA